MEQLWKNSFKQNNDDSQSDVNQKESSSSDDEESDNDDEESVDKTEEEVSNIIITCVLERKGDDSDEVYNAFLKLILCISLHDFCMGTIYR